MSLHKQKNGKKNLLSHEALRKSEDMAAVSFETLLKFVKGAVLCVKGAVFVCVHQTSS